MTSPFLKRNNVVVYGKGSQPVLFAHGFGCNQHMWRFVAPAFAPHYRVVLFDYVGAGTSDLGAYDSARYNDLQGYAQDVLDVCAALDLHDTIFVGHSVSGMIGLLAAIQEPARFAHLVLVAPSPCYLNHPPTYHGGFERADLEDLLGLMAKNDLGWASFLAPTVMQHPERPELTQELEASFCATDPQIAQEFATVTFFSDNRQDLAKASVPALILQCADDVLAPRAVGDYLHQHMPNSTLRVLQTTGHCPHMTVPADTIDAITAYLETAGAV